MRESRATPLALRVRSGHGAALRSPQGERIGPGFSVFLCFAIACSAGAGEPADAGDVDAGTSGPSWSAPQVLDANAGSGLDLVAGVDPQGKIGTAYFALKSKGKWDLVVAREGGESFTTDVA